MSETRMEDRGEARRAVCFDRRDYAGVARRIVIICVDLVGTIAVAVGALVACAWIYLTLYPAGDLPVAMIWVPLVAAYLYLTVLKRSRVRTLGYILAGVRIVDIEGRRPSLLQMTIRMFPLMPVPWSLLFDLGWVAEEPHRQSLRDKWAGTFVVRRSAQPIATAPIRYHRIGFSGIFLIYPEVGPAETSAGVGG